MTKTTLKNDKNHIENVKNNVKQMAKTTIRKMAETTFKK